MNELPKLKFIGVGNRIRPVTRRVKLNRLDQMRFRKDARGNQFEGREGRRRAGRGRGGGRGRGRGTESDNDR